MIKKKKSGKSIRTQLLFSVLGVNLAVMIVLIGVMVISGVFERLNMIASRNLNKIVDARSSDMNNAFLSLIDISRDATAIIERKVNNYYGSTDKSISELLDDQPSEAINILSNSLNTIIDVLDLKVASDAFVVLDTSAFRTESSAKRYASIYIKNEDMRSYGTRTQGKIAMRGGKMVSSLGIPFDNYWSEEWEFGTFDEFSSDFFYNPYNAAKANKQLTTSDLGYFSPPTYLFEDNIKKIVYTVPIRDASGEPYGVFGLCLSKDHIKPKIDNYELSYSTNSFYMITEMNRFGENGEARISNGSFATQFFQGEHKFIRELDDSYGENIFEYIGGYSGNIPAIIAIKPMNIYTERNPFYSKSDWRIWGAVKKADLFDSSDELARIFLYAFIVTLVLGFFVSVILVRSVTNPIKQLAQDVSNIDNEYNVHLKKTSIMELDLIVDSVEQFSGVLTRSAKLLMDTFKLTNTNIAVFEVNTARNRVFMTDLLFRIFEIEHEPTDYYISLALWHEKFSETFVNKEPKLDNVYIIDKTDIAEKNWYQIKYARFGSNECGIVIDITADILEKKLLQYERDIDALTKLINRRLFIEQSKEAVAADPTVSGVMIFIDLDNLKTTNDSYGHDVGNLYINGAAEVFKTFLKYNAYVSRASGDEFIIFLYGKMPKEYLLKIMEKHFRDEEMHNLLLPNGVQLRIQYSVGYAIYGEHSTDIVKLIDYADFSMYRAKVTRSGEFYEFNMDEYVKHGSAPRIVKRRSTD